MLDKVTIISPKYDLYTMSITGHQHGTGELLALLLEWQWYKDLAKGPEFWLVILPINLSYFLMQAS